MAICPNATIFNFSNPMSRICTTVHRAYPDLKFIGMCHEIGSLPRFLPEILGVPYDALEVRAGGLNHFSVVVSATYKETGQDAYPDIREKAPKFFGNMAPSDSVHKNWPERRVFQVILEKFGLMPITSDSHFGEYIQWAYDITDHKGILDFYNFYKGHLMHIQPQIELRLGERIIPIIEGILTDSGYMEEAVNVPNNGLFPNLPDWIVVEVPGIVDKNGIHGISPGELPGGFSGLLSNQIGVHDMTAEAAIHKSKSAALQALLVDPVVNQYNHLDEMLDTMITYQEKWLGDLR